MLVLIIIVAIYLGLLTVAALENGNFLIGGGLALLLALDLHFV